MMKMLKKHYEKFLFIFLLLIFLLLFGFQVLSLSDEKQEDKIPTPRRDYQSFDFSNDKYDSEKLFRNVSGNISLKKSASGTSISLISSYRSFIIL